MAQSMVQMVLFFAILVFIADGRTPPGIANNPSNARCLDSKYKTCYNLVHVCPKFCPNSCTVHCQSCKPICAAVPETPPVVVTPPPPSPSSTPTPPKTECDKPGAVCQDPRFVGGDGNVFYFHGKKNQEFCLLSDSNLHINAHFIGRRNSNMKRDFTWVQSIGVLFDNHQIFVGAQKTSTWEDSTDRLSLSFDGEPILLAESKGANWQSDMTPGVSFTRSSDTNGIVVEVKGKFKFTAHVVPITEQDSKVHNYGITKEDCFAHLDLGFKFYELTDGVDGVLGKTYSRDYVSTVKKGVPMPVMGGEKNFSSSSLFSTDCKVARFGASVVGDASETSDYPSLNCGSGIGGRGVVCKR